MLVLVDIMRKEAEGLAVCLCSHVGVLADFRILWPKEVSWENKAESLSGGCCGVGVCTIFSRSLWVEEPIDMGDILSFTPAMWYTNKEQNTGGILPVLMVRSPC
jgi:hypothetical protein